MPNYILSKSYRFSVRIVNLYKYLCSSKNEYIISKQLVRSGTSICANVVEAQDAQSRPDFTAKLSISLKEASETRYWLKLLFDTGYLNSAEYQSIEQDCLELKKLLTSILKTLKS